MLEQRLQQQFFDSADLTYACAEALAKPMADAVHALVGSITAGSKVLVFGAADAAWHARYMAAKLLGRFERERPGLAALALTADGGDGPADLWLRQLETLGQPGDVLLALACGEASPNLLEAIAHAHAKDMTVVALTGRNTALKDKLAETDVHIAIPHERPARIHEVQWLILHSLCDAVDLQLLGEQDNS